MSMKLNRAAYEHVIAEDRAWLAKQPRTLERDHIDLVLKVSPEHEYALAGVADPAALVASHAELTTALLKFGAHREWCKTVRTLALDNPLECSCGLEAARARAARGDAK